MVCDSKQILSNLSLNYEKQGQPCAPLSQLFMKQFLKSKIGSAFINQKCATQFDKHSYCSIMMIGYDYI